MQIGIVGLPFAGKSTLFQALSRTRPDAAAPARGESHQAVVKVPDARLDMLASVFRPRKTVHAVIEVVDVAGLQRGENGRTQFTSAFLGAVKNNDALVQVVRLFGNDAVPHPDGSVDAVRDAGAFDAELLLADMALLEGRLERLQKGAGKGQEEQMKRELPVLKRCHELLDAGTPLRAAEFSKEELLVLRTYQLLTLKPMLIALNLDETQLAGADAAVRSVAGTHAGQNTAVLAFFGKIDLEMAELPEEEARAFMAEYGIRESALDTLLREAYALLGLRSFFTVGEDECRAWTIRAGMTAQESAGVIHSDFVSKFIRAEVVHYDDFLAQGSSMAKAREAGVWRLEGKEYPVKDGDILNIRHS